MKRIWLVMLAVASPILAALGYVDAHFDSLYDSWERWKYKRWENDYRGGFQEGQEGAIVAMEAGLTNYCGHGLIRPGATNDGLPIATTGCVVIRRDEGFADGYNSEVAKARAQTKR